MVSQAYGANSMSHYIALTPFSSFSLLESWISTSSYVVAPSLVAIIGFFVKIPLHNLSNISLVNSLISFTHLIATPISSINCFPSSHSNDNGDAKGEIAFKGTML